MAVGAGNIWRFPRLIGEFGGTFLIPWLLFLLLWSIPLAIFEYAVGKKTRKGVIGAFSHLFGQQFAWLGSFVAFCTTAILFYYTVVTGWSLWYALNSLSGGLKKADSLVFWETFTTGQMPLLAALVVLLLAYLVMSRQFNKGLEKINKVALASPFCSVDRSCRFCHNPAWCRHGPGAHFSYRHQPLTGRPDVARRLVAIGLVYRCRMGTLSYLWFLYAARR